LLLAMGGPIALAFVLEYTNSSFRTPSEVFSELNIPVLAAVPHQAFAFSASRDGGMNGNGNSNGNGNGNGTHSAPVFVSNEVNE
jgi:hypothetical protein